MSSRAEPLAGPLAAEALSTPGRGRILAVFAAVFYVELPGGILCIARPGVPPGPLTVIAGVPQTTDWRACGLDPGEPAVLGAPGLRAGPITLGTGGAALWTPDPWATLDPARLTEGLARLRSVPSPTQDGLAAFLVPGAEPSNPAARAAAAPMAAARVWLAEGGDTHWARQLLGLGPGLTPSGDDVLGGMMLALHATGRGDLAAALFDTVAPDLEQATTPISASLVAAAARGFGSEPLHLAVNRILANDDPGLVVPRLARIGHTSGLDALAGVIAVLDPLARPACRAA